MSEAILDIKDLWVIYKTDLETVKAVNGIDLRIDKGKTLGLVGETGAGKTTTALSILRLLPSNTGRILKGSITFAGEDILGMNEPRIQSLRGEKIAMVFQDPMTSLNPVMTVGEQIAEAILLHNEGIAKAEVERRVEAMLGHGGHPGVPEGRIPPPVLRRHEAARGHRHGPGLRTRAPHRGRAHHGPGRDHPGPGAHHDQGARNRLGTSMLMITHNLGIVAKTCDDVAVMYAGEIVEAGTVEDLFLGRRHHPYTEGLFGSIPNLTSRTARLTPIPGLMPDPTNLPKGCAFEERCAAPHGHLPCSGTRGRATEGTHSILCHLYGEKP